MIRCLVCTSDPTLSDKIAGAVRPHAHVELCSPAELAGRPLGVHAVIADERALSVMGQPPPGVQVVGVSAGSISDGVEYLARQGALTQLVTPAAFDGRFAERMLYDDPAFEVDTLAFLGARHLHVHRALFYRSSDIEPRLAKLDAFAESAEARPRAVEQLHDVAGELLANAFYDAPYEAGYFPAPPARQEQIRLPPEMPCEMIYGADGDELFVRVRDCFGALTRRRLLEVLMRCARSVGAVPLDESRGGAGLGMWRIFRQSNRVVVAVVPGSSTEMLVTVPKNGLGGRSLRCWHLLFAEPLHAEAQVNT